MMTGGGLFLLRWRKWRGISARRLPGSRSLRPTLGWFTIGWNERVVTNTRATIIKACAERQAIYEAKKVRAQERGNDDSFDRAQVGYEVCTYLLTDILLALDMAPAEIDDDDRVKGAA
jgi:hypothetical protein